MLFIASCINSQYPAGEPKDQITDDKIVGTWLFQSNKEFKNFPPAQAYLCLLLPTKIKVILFKLPMK